MAQGKKPPAKGAGRPQQSRGGASGAKAAIVKKPSGRPPARKPGKSIVNQKQTPWGLIATCAAVVVFAAGVVIAVVVSVGNDDGTQASNPYRQAELADAKEIPGLTYKVEPDHDHVQGAIKYDATPPVGGNHSQYWADCTGTVYPKAIANENAVHALEHGGVWVTYREGLPQADVDKLAKLVKGINYSLMSPYPKLKEKVSVQAWGYQLFSNDVDDPAIADAIGLLRHNPKTTPEYGASCSQPTFKTIPSTFGHPLWSPAKGSATPMSSSA